MFYLIFKTFGIPLKWLNYHYLFKAPLQYLYHSMYESYLWCSTFAFMRRTVSWPQLSSHSQLDTDGHCSPSWDNCHDNGIDPWLEACPELANIRITYCLLRISNLLTSNEEDPVDVVVTKTWSWGPRVGLFLIPCGPLATLQLSQVRMPWGRVTGLVGGNLATTSATSTRGKNPTWDLEADVIHILTDCCPNWHLLNVWSVFMIFGDINSRLLFRTPTPILQDKRFLYHNK